MSFRRRRGHETTVVLVHGIPGAAGGWDRVVAALADGLDIVVPDLLGFASSARPASFTIDTVGPQAQASALENLLDEIAVRGALLVGHDFGGPISVVLARRRPDLVSQLLLLAANTFPDTPIPFPLSLTTAPVIGGLAARAMFSRYSLAVMLRRGVGAGSPPDPAVYIGDGRQRRAIAAIFSGALGQLAEVYRPVEAALRRLEVPVAVGWGDKDPFFPVAQGRRTADAAGADLRIFAGAGHFLPHERPEEIAREIERLIAARAA